MSQTVLNLHMEEIGRYPLLSRDEVNQLVARFRGDDATDAQWAFEQLVRCNLRLAVHAAKRYHDQLSRTVRANIELADLIQVGYEGIMRAVQSFEPAKGYAFSTYASWWLRHRIERYIKQQGHTIVMPQDVIPVRRRIYEAQRELADQGVTNPTDEQVAELANQRRGSMKTLATPEQVGRLRQYDQLRPISFDAFDAPFIADQQVGPERETVRLLMRERLYRAMGDLPADLAVVVSVYYGFDGGEPRTLREIGIQLGVSRTTIDNRLREAHSRLQSILGNELNDFRGLELLSPEMDIV